jgi:nitrogen fixation NifU-like protein
MREYSPQIVNHFNAPQNYGMLAHADRSVVVSDPCCGDQLHLHIRLDGERIAACSFQAFGCATTIALGSLITVAVTGKLLSHLAQLDEPSIAQLAGTLSPNQRHSAALAHGAVQALTGETSSDIKKGV